MSSLESALRLDVLVDPEQVVRIIPHSRHGLIEAPGSTRSVCGCTGRMIGLRGA